MEDGIVEHSSVHLRQLLVHHCIRLSLVTSTVYQLPV